MGLDKWSSLKGVCVCVEQDHTRKEARLLIKTAG